MASSIPQIQNYTHPEVEELKQRLTKKLPAYIETLKTQILMHHVSNLYRDLLQRSTNQQLFLFTFDPLMAHWKRDKIYSDVLKS
jgi:hypothetical protein